MAWFKKAEAIKEPIKENDSSRIEEARKYLEELGLNDGPTLSFKLEDSVGTFPGGAKANMLGCTCDAEANTFGKGLYRGMRNWNGKLMFAVLDDCPVHGLSKV